MDRAKVIDFFKPVKIGDSFHIQDSLPFDGRVVAVKKEREGVKITEEIDGDQQHIYLSNAEIGALIYRLSESIN